MRVIALAVAALALTGCGRLTGVGGSEGAGAAEESLEVAGASMEPTLHCARPSIGCRAALDDEVVFVDEETVERRDIVAFRVGAKAAGFCGARGLYVKRVVALAGDRVEFRDGAVYVDDRRLKEPYASGPTEPAEEGSTIVVPPNHVLVLGDNRAESCDSRVWGPLAVRKVVGVGVAIQRGGRRIPLP